MIHNPNAKVTVPASGALARVRSILQSKTPVPYWLKKEAIADLESASFDYGQAMQSKVKIVAEEAEMSRASDMIHWILETQE